MCSRPESSPVAGSPQARAPSLRRALGAGRGRGVWCIAADSGSSRTACWAWLRASVSRPCSASSVAYYWCAVASPGFSRSACLNSRSACRQFASSRWNTAASDVWASARPGSSSSAREAGVLLKGLLVEADGLHEPVLGPQVPGVTAAQVHRASLWPPRPRPGRPRVRRRRSRRRGSWTSSFPCSLVLVLWRAAARLRSRRFGLRLRPSVGLSRQLGSPSALKRL